MYFLLEREGSGCDLYRARQVKALPGRPETGKPDSGRLAEITGRGQLPSSFVPPEDIRARTRYRRHLTRARAAEMARCEKLPEDARLKLSSVISDIHGVPGPDMLTAIIAGERSAAALAQLARGRMRVKIRELEQALDCSFFTAQHAFILKMMLASIDHLTAQIDELPAPIAVLCEPYARQIARLDAIPGSGIITAGDITAGDLCSRARQAPRVSQSAGKGKGKNATGTGGPCAGAAPGEAAIGAGRTQTFPGARYRRLIQRMPGKKAQGAIIRTRLVICRTLLSDPGAACTGPGAGYCGRRASIRRDVRNHARAIERRGYKVIPGPLTPGTGPITVPAAKAS